MASSNITKQKNNMIIKNINEKFNLLDIPLSGINLIEASAGTGKTFAIIVMYLRLLLGIGKNKNFIRKLLVNEILVVTFSNSAKEELYIRIKQAIENLYLSCTNKISNDSISDILLKEIKDTEKSIHVLKKAKNNINHLSIYTIHGFCQQILQSYTFYFNFIFQEKIIENEENLYLQATEDFWRRYFYNLPEDIVRIIYKNYESPKTLLKKIKPLLYIKVINFQNKKIKKDSLIILHTKNIKQILLFKKIWLTHCSCILNIIKSLNINKRIYNESNLVRWIKNITQWAESKTTDYTIPISLKYFSKENIEKNIIKKINLKCIIFKESEKFLKKKFSLNNIIIFLAIKNIPKFLSREKEKRSLIGFNDLLNRLLKSIKKEHFLKQLISEKYPAAFIDEFQDTDIEQYEIFNNIYKKNKNTTLFLIGDPKQAIYSFRGADIFSYLYAKSKIKKHYRLNINWRSSINMCKSINILFNQNKNPFIFKNIQFTPILPSLKNSQMNFKIKEIIQTSISFFLKKKKEISIEEYQNWISEKCAHEISYWLQCAKKNEAKIITKYGERTLKHNDIAILVRNKKEAHIIQYALKKLNINSIYSSYRDSVFKNSDAKELLWILNSILEPTNEKYLQKSITTHILKTIIFKQKEKKNKYFIIEKLYEYHEIWKKIGIFHMIKNIILDYQNNTIVSETYKEHQKNLNFLHIAELLQEKSQYFCKKNSLILWFRKKIIQEKEPAYNECIKYFNDESKFIKIVTIHKSKGLEYPIVWIPFSIDFNEKKLPLYHNKKNFKIFFDTDKNEKILKISDEERLAEDLRFLYVAITRSILHCSIGIASLTKKKIKNKDNSDIHKSALGYIIQNGKIMNYEELYKKLKKIKINHLIEIKNKINNFKFSKTKKIIYLISKPFFLDKKLKNIFKITSFTKISQENKLLKNFNCESTKKDCFIENKTKKIKNTTVHNFPSGKKTGILIHNIMKNLNFLNKKEYDWYASVLNKNNISDIWTKILMYWIKKIINTPFHHEKITLSKLRKNSFIQELEFFLPIKNILYNSELNKIMQFYDPISKLAPELNFNPVRGILKGSIDLFFIWKKKYYILDYKSNWLGKDDTFYSIKNIKHEIIKHRYDFQYQIYTTAIDQYLKNKIKNYSYEKNFGGIFYIFIRGINKKEQNNSIFYTLPNYSLIENINLLIS